MKKFKSILALTASVLALSAFAAPLSAFASDTSITGNGTGDSNGDMTVNGGKDVSYTVVIPASVNVDDTTGNTNTGNVIVYNAFLGKGKSVFVKATSTYGDNTDNSKNFKMALKTGESTFDTDTKVLYTVTSGGTAVTNGGNFLEVKQANLGIGGEQEDATATAANAGLSTSLTFALDGNYPVAGNYQDTLTFTISYTDSTPTI